MPQPNLATVTPIAAAFASLKTQGRMAFMPFITAGDPDLATTVRLISELAKRGVDLIEVGFPYSDPIADGPVIQASYTRALGKGIHVRDIFAAIERWSAEARGNEPSGTQLPPLVAMVSYAIIFRMGSEAFVREAAAAGFAGLIVPDLPAEEALELAEIVRNHALDLIELIAPTTTPARAQRILAASTGFLYCISAAGTTGVRTELPPELHAQLQWIRTQTDLPIAVGFGVSRPEQVDSLRGLADGIIVGSALVRHVAAITEQQVPADRAIEGAGRFAAEMVAAAHNSAGPVNAD